MASRVFQLLPIVGILFILPAHAQVDPQAWLSEVDSLITPREREAFLGLTQEADRQAFIQRFWQVRDPYPETARNEARERWQERLAEARRRWSDPQDERTRIFLVSGEPDAVFQTRCAGVPIEVWDFQPRFQTKYRTLIIFTGGESGPAHLWHPGDAPDLVAAAAGPCSGEQPVKDAALWVRLAGRDAYATVVKRGLTLPGRKEGVASFQPVAAPARTSRSTLPAQLDVAFPGRLGEGLVRVFVAPGQAMAPVSAAPGELIVTGRILSGDETVDSFRYRFDALPTAGGVGAWPISFERRLRPGRYKLEVELDAAAADNLFVGERELAVPEPGAPAAPAAATVTDPPVVLPAAVKAPAPEVSPEVKRLFAEADASLAAPRPGLRILASGSRLLAGVQRFEARVDRAAGVEEEGQIERVAFYLDGRQVLTRNRPPYVAQLDLGRAPRPHKLAVEAWNRGGDALAKAAPRLNAGAQRFAVRLAEPHAGAAYQRSLRAEVRVEAPEDRAVERVELYLGDARVATLYQPPYVQPLLLPQAAKIDYVRAVAYLADGTAAEDLVLLNAPAATDRMDIRLVELYTNVVDGAGK